MNKLVTISEVCEMFNRHRSTLWVWVDEGKFPKPIKMNGRTIGWTKDSINKWMEGEKPEHEYLKENIEQKISEVRKKGRDYYGPQFDVYFKVDEDGVFTLHVIFPDGERPILTFTGQELSSTLKKMKSSSPFAW